MTTKIAGITEILKAKQRSLGLTDLEFAAKLEISRTLWNFIKNGARKPGMKILKSAMRQFPEMTLSIMNFLAEDNGAPEKIID